MMGSQFHPTMQGYPPQTFIQRQSSQGYSMQPVMPIEQEVAYKCRVIANVMDRASQMRSWQALIEGQPCILELIKKPERVILLSAPSGQVSH